MKLKQMSVARGQGFEPQLAVLETAVLPLHYPKQIKKHCTASRLAVD